MKKFFAIAKILSCLFLTLIFTAWSAYILIIAFASNFILDWQIILFILLSILTIVGLWLICFIKTKITTKIAFAIIFISFIFAPRIFPSVMLQLKIDSCLDSGGCWDDIRSRCEMEDQGFCIESAEKCKNLWNGMWDKENQYCRIKIKKKTP